MRQLKFKHRLFDYTKTLLITFRDANGTVVMYFLKESSFFGETNKIFIDEVYDDIMSCFKNNTGRGS